jgi:protein O-mannosyl-transferase
MRMICRRPIADFTGIDLQCQSPSTRSPAARISPVAWGLCLLLMLLTFVSFLPVLRAGLIDFDDNEYISQNRFVLGGLSMASLRWAWMSTVPGYWQPLSWMSLMLDSTLFHPSTFAFHRTNLLLHAASAGVMFLVLSSMTGSLWRAALVAAIYAVHPLRVESVAWAAERKDVLSNLLAWLAIGGYVAYARRPSPRTYLLVLIPFALALLAKPMVITLPCVLLLLDYWPLGRLGEKRWTTLIWEKLPLFFLAGPNTRWPQG